MLNNKGFAVSTVLYTLLIAFLLFLGATLAMFSSSNSLVSNANKDLINGTKFEAVQVKTSEVCVNGKNWYESNIIVKVESRYGTKYWPRDFTVKKFIIPSESLSIDGKIKAVAKTSFENSDLYELTFTDTITEAEVSVTIGDICS